MLEVIIYRYEVNCTTKYRLYTEYYAKKKTNVNVCPKKCVTLPRLSCLITEKENFLIKIGFFKQTRPHEYYNWINILDKQKTKLAQDVQKKACLEGYVAYVTLFQNITCMLYKMN